MQTKVRSESRLVRVAVACSVILAAPHAAGQSQERGEKSGDQFDLLIHAETRTDLFRRAVLPGPNGALTIQTAAPVRQDFFLFARDLDPPWGRDNLDLEFAAWGRAWVGDRNTERLLDGDIQTANVRYRYRPIAVRLGRQHVAGGAARYAWFDGLDLAAALGSGFELEAYSGLTVLPRWDHRPGYYYLGAAADSELKDPSVLPEPARSRYWLAGGRLGWSSPEASATLSFHEQREQQG
ncbi:MAG TPA: hypothetical protein VGK54_14005, partial [Chloroflexota bacterium]